MQKPTANCKHAQFQIEHQLYYSQKEYDECEGKCWQCGKTLTLRKPRQHKLELEDITVVGKKLTPEETQALLKSLNAPEYICLDCFKLQRAKWKTIKPEDCIPASQWLEEMRGEKGRERYKRNLSEYIAEIEVCVADCPCRDDLPTLKKNLQSADKKIEGFDND